MTRGFVVGCLALFMAVVAPSAAKVTARQKAIAASDAWVAAPTKDSTTALAFATVENPTMYEIYIVSATADAAGRVEFRDGDKPAKDLAVPAYGSLVMSPAAGHIVLADLKKALQPGDAVALTLTTDAGITIAVTATVRAK